MWLLGLVQWAWTIVLLSMKIRVILASVLGFGVVVLSGFAGYGRLCCFSWLWLV